MVSRGIIRIRISSVVTSCTRRKIASDWPPLLAMYWDSKGPFLSIPRIRTVRMFGFSS